MNYQNEIARARTSGRPGRWSLATLSCLLALGATTGRADTNATSEPEGAKAVPSSAPAAKDADPASAPADASFSPMGERSPWMLMPLFSSNPKLGTSLGGLGGYLHSFDAKSRPSIFAVQAQYTSTDSITAGALAKASWDEDHHRVIAGLVFGRINNDYDDYLGSGVPLKNTAELFSFIGRYTYRVAGDWFVGGQIIKQNFNIVGDSDFDNDVLDTLGIQPYKSAGGGLVVQNDTRDNENKPTKGWLFTANNLAFREGLGSDYDYDVYRIDFRYFLPFGNGHVLALRQLNHLTSNAPQAARAPVQLRGYKIGEYTDVNMSSIEAEARIQLAKKWTATVFAGIAYLYGGDHSSDSGNYPAAGAGIQYVLKPIQGIVLNLEYAAGKDHNQGVYLKMGYAY